MAKDSFIFHLENAEDLEDLTLEEQGMILQAMIQYSLTGEEPGFTDKALRAVWRPIFRRLKADKEAYDDKCRKNKESAEKRWANANASEEMRTHKTHIEKNANHADSDSDTDSDTDIEKKKAPTEPKKKSTERFSPPSVEEVRAYAAEKGYRIDAEGFCAFYESKGWKVGNQPMKNWKAAIVTWSKRDNRAGPPKIKTAPSEQHIYDMDELRRRAKA